MSVIIYHNPRCSKSRQTLELIKEKGIEPVIVDYLENPPGVMEIRNILKMLDKKPIEVIRKKEAKEEGVDMGGDDMSLMKAMAANPRIIERPIVCKGDKAVLGRPPENVHDLL
ncbi:MAG: arsenate reductase (glutaredoxin) [Rhodospirillales bacterium]|nr:arsenate reductase (glutaredoxin) [Rhodospirillales bacterium]